MDLIVGGNRKGSLVPFTPGLHAADLKRTFATRGAPWKDMKHAAEGKTFLVPSGQDWATLSTAWLKKNTVFAVEDATGTVQGFVWCDFPSLTPDVAFLSEKDATGAGRDELLMAWALGRFMKHVLTGGTVARLTAKPDASAGKRVPYYLDQLMLEKANGAGQRTCTLATLGTWENLVPWSKGVPCATCARLCAPGTTCQCSRP